MCLQLNGVDLLDKYTIVRAVIDFKAHENVEVLLKLVRTSTLWDTIRSFHACSVFACGANEDYSSSCFQKWPFQGILVLLYTLGVSLCVCVCVCVRVHACELLNSFSQKHVTLSEFQEEGGVGESPKAFCDRSNSARLGGNVFALCVCAVQQAGHIHQLKEFKLLNSFINIPVLTYIELQIAVF